MIPDNVTNLLWMFVVLIIFYMYMDMRITRLRTELMSHYMVCEKMLNRLNANQSDPRNDLQQYKNEQEQSSMPSSIANSQILPGNITLLNSNSNFKNTGEYAEFDFDYTPSKNEIASGYRTFDEKMREFHGGNCDFSGSLGWSMPSTNYDAASLQGFNVASYDFAPFSF